MHKGYFPRCDVAGPIEPAVPFNHLSIGSAIPNKCGSCDQMFEGGCRRAITSGLATGYLHLDHGPCGVAGATDPIYYDDKFISAKVTVPRKCGTCRFLSNDSIFGFYCSKDSGTWGRLHRGLDWGAWSPERIYLELPTPKITTRALADFAHDDDRRGFVSEHRRVNPGLSMEEANQDFALLRETIKSGESALR
jgi:hypothetical protein